MQIYNKKLYIFHKLNKTSKLGLKKPKISVTMVLPRKGGEAIPVFIHLYLVHRTSVFPLGTREGSLYNLPFETVVSGD